MRLQRERHSLWPLADPPSGLPTAPLTRRQPPASQASQLSAEFAKILLQPLIAAQMRHYQIIAPLFFGITTEFRVESHPTKSIIAAFAD